LVKEVIYSVDGLDFSALAAGDGVPVLLLHGFPDLNSGFRYHLESLADLGLRAIAPALRGYPPTGGPGPYTADQLRSDTLGLARAVGMSEDSPGFLVGHDWGGIAACLAAGEAPELFQRTVVASVPHPASFAARVLGGDYDQLKRSWYMFFFQLEGLAEAAIRTSKMALLERLMLDWSPSLLKNEGSDLIHSRLEAMAQPGVLESALGYYRSVFPTSGGPPPLVAKPVSVPALLVFGSEDNCIPHTVASDSSAFFPAGYEIEVVSGAGHFVHTEKPEAFARILERFITGTVRNP
jgi:pimeloyl-ACP methyl ester carboxylesterase